MTNRSCASFFVVMLIGAVVVSCNDNELAVVNNRPVAQIDQPVDGETFVEGEVFQALGLVKDDDDNDRLTVTWRSSLGDLCSESEVEPSSITTCEVTAVDGASDLCLVAYDGRRESEDECVHLTIVPSDPPTATIIMPVASGVYHSDWPITFEGIVADTEDEPDTLVASWSSSLDGELVEVDAVPDLEGDILGYGYLTEGVHVVELTVFDSTDRRGQASVTIEVGPPNSAPTCSIVEPVDGSAAPLGTCVSFEGVVADPDQDPDTLTVVWSSDQDGELAESTPDSDGSVSFTTCDLSFGPHRIRLEVLDDVEDTCTTSIDYVVGSGPTCEILSPVDGEIYYEGDPVSFEATVHDDGGALSGLGIEWASSVDGVFDTTSPDSYGNVLALWSGLSVATHSITLTATDGDGLTGRCTVAELNVEDCIRTWYEDLDGDGYGNDSTAVDTCAPPSGYVTLGGDCDDTVTSVHPGAAETCDGVDEDCDGTIDDGVAYYTYYLDADGDGYGDSRVSSYDCSAPSGYVTASGDCDDGDSSINPGAAETCDGVDEDCDGIVDDGFAYVDWYPDGDADGYGDDTATPYSWCAATTGFVDNADDCDDEDADINPDAVETCDGVDEDCDGSIDDGVTYSDWWPDDDGDGFGSDSAASFYDCVAPSGYVDNDGDCDDSNDAINPDAAEICNGDDDDCDGVADDGITYATYYADDDGDGYGNPAVSSYTCSAPAGYVTNSSDCDDMDAGDHPGATEVCNGDDDDCDGTPDDGLTFRNYYQDSDGDGYGGSAVSSYACSTPSGYVTSSTDCDDANASIHPGATELCNGVDDDCDSAVDDGLTFRYYYPDSDGDGYGASSGATYACSAPTGYVTSSTDCDDYDSSVHPGASEVCNGDDDDCDGSYDEGLSFSYYYRDSDGDGYGVSSSSTYACSRPSGYSGYSTDCDDADSSVHPGASESCDDEDNDCDGVIDDNSSCWKAIYRFIDPVSGAHCWDDDTTPPSRCSGFTLEIEAWIARANSSSNTWRAVQCSSSSGTDHIIVEDGSSDESALTAAGYNCSISLGYIYDLGAAPTGTTPYANTCDLYRYSGTTHTGYGEHLFTRGGDSVSAYTCEPPARGEVMTDHTCFSSTPSGCY